MIIFAVTDIETTVKNRLAFDVAWLFIDEKGNEYAEGSYLATDSVSLDAPWFKDKVGRYFRHVANNKIKPVTFREIKWRYNRAVRQLQEKGHMVVFAAYNAAFDTRELGKTSQTLLGEPFLETPIYMMDIWHTWAETCPLDYHARPTESGKNLSTTAESVYRFEFEDDGFIEHHVAFQDVQAEKDILLKILERNGSNLPIITNPAHFEPSPWRIANDRVMGLAA